jgi:ring-1,2-phenylacetyl-CoA epoxidase subunit PaaD
VSAAVREATTPLEQEVWRMLEDVPDPEIPVLTVVDLGIIRFVRETSEHAAEVGVSPTYTGCPATEVIKRSIEDHLRSQGVAATVKSVMSPPWSSDDLTEGAREKLKTYGIAPPAKAVHSPKRLFKDPMIRCPRCNSAETQRVSEFASTPCKALYRCASCLEPFEYFKCI